MSKDDDVLAVMKTVRALIAIFEDRDEGVNYSDDLYRNDANASNMVWLAEEILQVSQEILLTLIPNRVFQVAYGSDGSDQSNELDAMCFANRIRLLRRLLAGDGQTQYVQARWSDFLFMLKGDTTDTFGPSHFNAHGNQLPVGVALSRTQALAAYKVGRSNNIPTQHLQAQISTTFKTSFDSIRKWDRYCERVLGQAGFEYHFKHAANEWQTLFDSGIFETEVAREGQRYCERWRKARKSE